MLVMGFVRQMKALVHAQNIDSNNQKDGVKILQVETSIYKRVYGCPSEIK